MAKTKKCNFCGLDGLQWTTVDGKYKLAHPTGALHTIEECKARNPVGLNRSGASGGVIIPVTSASINAAPVAAPAPAPVAAAVPAAPTSSLAKIAAARKAKPVARAKATMSITEQGLIEITLNGVIVMSTLEAIHKAILTEEARAEMEAEAQN